MKKLLIITVFIYSSTFLYSLSDNNWNYKIFINNQGTRSQGETGLLRYKGNLIRFNFDNIICSLGKFVFIQGYQRWGFKGYKKISNCNSSSQTSMPLNKLKLILKRGFYKGKIKYSNIPASWIIVSRNQEFYVVCPDKIAKLIKYKNWNFRSVYNYLFIKNNR